MKNTKYNISNFNKYLIFIIIILFLYLFYLSIPSLYNKEKLQSTLTSKILKEFKINLSSSSDISYSILPFPHILIKDLKFFENNFVTPNELGHIKELRIFISQKNLFNQKNIKINRIVITDANFLVKKNNLKFYKEIAENKFLRKNILIKKSNFFYKDNNDEIIAIIPISEINLFHNKKNIYNSIITKGEVFTIPFYYKWTKYFSSDQSIVSLLEFKKLNLVIKNILSKKDKKVEFINYINLNKLEFNSSYVIKDNLITISSIEQERLHKNINYSGLVNIDPFDLKFDINLDLIDINKILSSMFILEELLKLDLIYNKNLNAKILLNSKNILNNKLFDSLLLSINFNNGKINIDNSVLFNKEIGNLKLSNSSFQIINNELFFKGSFNFNIDNQKEFYKSFQVNKNNRKNLKSIQFDIEYDFFKKKISIKNLKLNSLNVNEQSYKVQNMERFITKLNKKNINWINIKNLINDIFRDYSG